VNLSIQGVPGSPQLHTRWSDQHGGPFPLRVLHSDDPSERRIEVATPVPRVFTTAREFMVALHGERFARRHWTLDRYLGQGRYAPHTDRYGPAIALVGPPGMRVDTRITVLRRPPGIDLGRRGHEVAKLLRSGFHGWITTSGYEFTDVLQEVYKKILVANRGKSPWDPEKSSFGHYVHLVCYSALSNFHRREGRVRLKEQLGLPGVGPDGLWALVDVSGVAKNHVGRPAYDPVRDLQQYIGAQDDPVAPLAARLVPFVYEGYTLKAAAEALGVNRTEISRANKALKAYARVWDR
jgi:hypothetical protein